MRIILSEDWNSNKEWVETFISFKSKTQLPLIMVIRTWEFNGEVFNGTVLWSSNRPFRL